MAGAQEGEETSEVEAKANNLFKPTLTTYHVRYAPSGVMVLLIFYTALTYGIPILLHHHHRALLAEPTGTPQSAWFIDSVQAHPEESQDTSSTSANR
jgi:hypothetical protein